MSEEKLFQDLAPEERVTALRNHCMKSEETTVKRYFTPDEIASKKTILADNAVKQEEIIDEKAALNAPLDAQMKELKGERKEMSKQIRTGYFNSVEECFYFDDQENGVMNEYDVEGNLLSTRKLTRAEKQTNIKIANADLNSASNG